MMTGYHPLVKRLLDGEFALADLPPELRAEGEEALRLIGAADRAPVSFSAAVDARVMATVRRHAQSPVRRMWASLNAPRDLEFHVRVRPWAAVGIAMAAAAAITLLLTRASAPFPGPVARAPSPDSVLVRFVLYAPGAQQVAVAGTFNQWDSHAAPLIRAGSKGVWTTTLALPVGQHRYAFVVDGERWVPDPAATPVDDGFGRRNTVLAVTAQGARAL